MRRVLIGAMLLAGLAACGDATLDPLPLDIRIQASSVMTFPETPISFVVTAQGGELLGVTVDYGDGATDQYGAGGARTARVTFHHSYAAAGTYQVRATVTDAVAGEREAGVEVRVQQPPIA